MIGVFDSGVGGLTVTKELFKYLPEYQLIYFGDTAHLPYGTKSEKAIKTWSKEIVKFLIKKGAKIIVIACHTSSALAGDFLKKEFPKTPIFEIITPGINSAIWHTKNKKIGVIATPATIKSASHKEKLLMQNIKNLKVYDKSCPLFVPIIEENWQNTKVAKIVAKEYLDIFKKKKIDTLILGCTHYPLIESIITKTMGKAVKIINPAEQLALDIKEFIKSNPTISKKIKKGSNHSFFTSDEPYHFAKISKSCLGKEIKVKIVTI